MKINYIKYIIALLLFGSNGVVASFIDLSSYEIVMLRSVIGSLFLVLLFFVTRHRFTVREHKKDFMYIALSGVAMAADWLLLFEAYKRVGISLGMLINYCGPVIVVVLSLLIFHEHIGIVKAVALFFTFGGAVLISGAAVMNKSDIVGVVCAILSAFSYAAMILFNKKAKHIKGIENSVLQLTFTCVVVVIFVGFKQGLLVNGLSENILPVIWLGLINTGASCYLYFTAVSKLPVQTVAICGYLEPLSAVVFSFLILHERMGVWQVAGAVFIILGTVIGEVRKNNK